MFDLGCGDGTTAIPSARLGANVSGVDIARNLVAAGNARAKQRPYPISVSVKATPASGMNSRISHFDLVVSIFGAMFAPRPLTWPKR